MTGSTTSPLFLFLTKKFYPSRQIQGEDVHKKRAYGLNRLAEGGISNILPPFVPLCAFRPL